GGVDLTEVRRLALPQGVAMIFVDPSGENEIAILPGANSETSIADADRTIAMARPGDIVVTQQEIPQEATARALALARQKGIVTIVNTAPFLADTAQVVRDAAIVVANETEFALLAGSGPSESVMRNWARDRRQTIIVTLGAEGAWAARAETLIKVPALKVTPIDTVGAGDTFVGYLAAGLDAGLDLEAAMRRAAVAASLACLKPGAQPAIPQAAEVEAALSSGSR
ncbi:MAG TPA: PfkB family carbohydrate kinase, partial [Devosia sp.]|nr:PfkB family carbohydrate kinase [Devosia sp.]